MHYDEVDKPRFRQAIVWLAYAAVVFNGMMACFVRFPKFDGNSTPAPVRIYAVNGATCALASDAMRRLSLHDYRFEVVADCVEGVDPEFAARQARPDGQQVVRLVREQMVKDGVTLILDNQASDSGSSGEILDRYFLVRVNPTRWDRYTVAHEVGGHVSFGHTAIPKLVGPLQNAFLDLLIGPYLAFGRHWKIWSVLLFAALYWVARLRHQIWERIKQLWRSFRR